MTSPASSPAPAFSSSWGDRKVRVARSRLSSIFPRERELCAVLMARGWEEEEVRAGLWSLANFGCADGEGWDRQFHEVRAARAVGGDLFGVGALEVPEWGRGHDFTRAVMGAWDYEVGGPVVGPLEEEIAAWERNRS